MQSLLIGENNCLFITYWTRVYKAQYICGSHWMQFLLTSITFCSYTNMIEVNEGPYDWPIGQWECRVSANILGNSQILWAVHSSYGIWSRRWHSAMHGDRRMSFTIRNENMWQIICWETAEGARLTCEAPCRARKGSASHKWVWEASNRLWNRYKSKLNRK